jgi:hypothetical protein
MALLLANMPDARERARLLGGWVERAERQV